MPTKTRRGDKRRQVANVRVLPPDRARQPRPTGRITIDGRRIDMIVGDRLVAATLSPTFEGASTVSLTIHDEDRAVLRSGVFAENTQPRLELDGLGYELVGGSKNADLLSVTFESDVIPRLRRHGKGKPLRIGRNKITRAAFCAMMIRDAGVPVVVLDEAVVQQVAGRKKLKDELAKARRDAAKSNRSNVRGETGSNLTVKGKRADAEQRRVMTIALNVASEEQAPERPTLALLVALITESTARNLTYGDSTSTGVLQLLSDTAANVGIDARDVAGVCREFLRNGYWTYRPHGAIELATKNPGWTPGQIAQACQGSGHPDAYAPYVEEARRWLSGRGSLNAVIVDSTAWIKQYAFERRRNESTWKACHRMLVEEVGWRMFVREGVVVIASDPALMRADASVKIVERSETADDFDMDWHRALKSAAIQTTVRAGAYEIDPGETADVDGLPDLERKWLIATATFDLLGDLPQVPIELRRPQTPKPEPVSTIDSRTGASINLSGLFTAPGASASSFLAACSHIDGQNLPYVWAGGHVHAGTPDRGDGSDPGIGYDCSGAVGAAVAACGFGLKPGATVPGSGWFATNWGEPGHGKEFTLWANAGHIFAEIKGGGQFKSFDTRRIGDSRPGPHLRTALGTTAGFVPRRWPGH